MEGCGPKHWGKGSLDQFRSEYDTVVHFIILRYAKKGDQRHNKYSEEIFVEGSGRRKRH